MFIKTVKKVLGGNQSKLNVYFSSAALVDLGCQRLSLLHCYFVVQHAISGQTRTKLRPNFKIG